MDWIWVFLGCLGSALFMILLATKWKFPKIVAWIGSIAVALLIALLFICLYPLFPDGWLKLVVLLGQITVSFILGCSLVLFRFWRDPERTSPNGNGLILSPADGKIGYVLSLSDNSIPVVSKHGKDYFIHELMGINSLTDAAYLIGVEMSFLDVHVNRCPIGGKVTVLKHIKGKFMSLGKDEAQVLNARCTTVIEKDSLTLAVVQIASRLVRRVENYLSLNATVKQGQRLGIIRFGSLVAIGLPQREDIQILVKPGDHVTAGVSILAQYDESKG